MANGKDTKLFIGSDMDYKLPSKVLATIHGLYKYSNTEKLMFNLGKNLIQAL